MNNTEERKLAELIMLRAFRVVLLRMLELMDEFEIENPEERHD